MVKWGWVVSLSLKGWDPNSFETKFETIFNGGSFSARSNWGMYTASISIRCHGSYMFSSLNACRMAPGGAFLHNQSTTHRILISVCHWVEREEGMHSFVYAWLWLFDLWIEPTLLCKAAMSAKPLGLLASWYAQSMCTHKLHSKMWSAFSNKT